MRSNSYQGVAPRLSDRFIAAASRTLWAGLCLVGLLVGNTGQAAHVRIMPLGDSITVGIGDGTTGGYRGPLYQQLSNAGYSVDFVGSQTSGTITDANHEGHSGWRADQIRDNILNWLTARPADIVLLHIGTNDISQGEKAAGITAEIGQILDTIKSYESGHGATITVVLARIINRSNPASALGLETTALNVSIGSMAATRIAAGDHLVVVDMEPALTYPGDLADVVHPNTTGYGKMATVWFNALPALLRNKGDFISETIPAMLIPGSSYDCSVTMQNSGYQAWLCSPTGTRLTVWQSGGPVADKLIPFPGYEIYTNPCQIDVGQSAVFAFTISVPADTPLGQYEISWQMRDDTEWFNSNGHEAVFRKAVAVRLFPVYKGDFNDDGDVDQEDFGVIQACLGQPAEAACANANLDDDGTVDTDDVSVFQACLSGAGAAPPDNCIK